MLGPMFQYIPSEVWKILLVLFLAFILGLEREEKKARGAKYYFGGVRAFPLIGLVGYALAFLSGPALLPLAIGLGVVGSLLAVSYWHKVSTSPTAGFNNELTGLMTYLIGALVYFEHYWIAVALGVLSLLLLELKKWLESLANRIPVEELITFTKFLLLSAVILPVVPNQEFTRFHLNPYRIWLVVVAVSGVSYVSYLLQRFTKKYSSLLFSAILGGAYSSTFATVVLAKRSREQNRPHLFSGAILMASGVMYLRLILLLLIFNKGLAQGLWVPFLVLAAAAIVVGWLWTRRLDPSPKEGLPGENMQNPLELKSALFFAGIFLLVILATQGTLFYFGVRGMFALAAMMGFTDVDPFVMGLAQTAGSSVPWHPALAGILIATSGNNLIKGFYGYGFGDRTTGSMSLVFLTLLALAGLLPLLWLF